jgi:hypothetical protein
MRHITLAAATLTTFLAAPYLAHAADEAPRYAVVRIVNYDKSATNLVMSAAEWQTLKAEIQAETPLFGRALLAASKEWKADEIHRNQTFPSTAFGPRQATAIGPFYDSAQKASAALKLLPANNPLMESRRKQPKAKSEKDNIAAQALDLLVEQLDDMKGASQPGGNAEVSTNKIALTAGQVLSRTTAGKTLTAYHIAVPDNFNPEKPPPLLVVFSPGGDGRGMMNQLRASANKVGWMVIGCDKLKNDTSEAEDFPIEGDLIRDLHMFIPYDRTRLYYGGFSGGANRAYHMTCHFKDPCAGILAFGGWLGGGEDQKKPFQKNMAIAMVNGDTDPGARSWEEGDKTALKHRRCEVKIFHFPGGHAVAPPNVIDEAIAWLDKQADTISSKSKLPGK